MRLIDAEPIEAWMSDYENSEPYGLDAVKLEGMIREAPTIEPKHDEWIPCSEKLPEENVAVLTQANFKDDIKMAVSARQDYNYWTGWGTREVNIVAWMPLPKPWEGAKDV